MDEKNFSKSGGKGGKRGRGTARTGDGKGKMRGKNSKKAENANYELWTRELDIKNGAGKEGFSTGGGKTYGGKAEKGQIQAECQRLAHRYA